MPVSTSIHLSHCLARIQSAHPESVLDVGCGFGMWGFLCREYLDAWDGWFDRSQWRVRIDGIEVFEPYIQAHQRAIYSNIFVEDVRDAVKRIGEYDLIIAGDVIEHMEKADGEAVLEALYEKSRKALLVNLPLGDGWNHPEAYGNPAELHRSQWVVEDLAQYTSELERFHLPCGDYGAFWCSKEVPAAVRAHQLAAAAEFREKQGDPDTALRFLLRAQELDPGNGSALALLVDFLLNRRRVPEAVDWLRHGIQVDPGAHWVRLTLARVLEATGSHAEAYGTLQALLEQRNVPEEIVLEAERLREEIRRRFE